MLIAFQIVLLIVLLLSFFVAVGVDGEKGTRAAAVCIASVLAYTVSLLWV